MKTLSISILTIVALTSCNITTTTNLTNSENVKLVKELYEQFNAHQWTKMADMYAETADFKDPSFGQGIVKQTRKQIADKYAELNQTFPDIHDEVIEIYPSGDKHVIVEFVSTGTAPDGSKFELPICTIFTIENGLITRDFTYYDNSSASEASPE